MKPGIAVVSRGLVLSIALLIAASSAVAADTGERFRVFYRDRWVSYLETDGMAIAEGDILLGEARAIARLRDAAVPPKALVIDQTDILWPADASGVHRVPYTYEAGPQANIDAAVAQFNATFAGIIQWVPRASETDYVAFDLVGPTGSCFSQVGRIGGRQAIGGSPVCGTGPLLHEMGHAIGFWHTQSDAAQGSFLNIHYDTLDPRWTPQYSPILAARQIDGFDYGSIMLYGPFVQSTAPDPLTSATLPAGIDTGLRVGYSDGDVDAVKRLYGGAPASVTVTSNPPGLEVIIDGVASITPVVLDWRLGSLHRLDVRPELQAQGAYRFAFGRWSHDPSANPVAAQEVIVDPGQGFFTQPSTAPRNGVLVANFIRLVQVSQLAVGNGTINSTPETPAWPGTTNFFPQYTKFLLEAQTDGDALNTWLTSPSFFTLTGGGGGVLTAERRITSLSPAQVGGTLFAGPAILLQQSGPGVDGTLRANVTSPGATTPTTTLSPNVLRSSTPGDFIVAADANLARSDSVRFTLESIDGLDNPLTGAVAPPDPGQPSKVVTLNFRKEFQALIERHPVCGGFVALSKTATWLPFGTTMTATVSLASGAVLAGWGGVATGTGVTTNTITVDRVPYIVAYFNTIAEPLRVTSIAPAAYQRGQGPQTFRFTGSGFTAATFLSKESGEHKAGSAIDSHTFEVTLNDGDFTHTGKTVLTLGATIAAGCNAFSDDVAVDVLPFVAPQYVTVHEFYNASLDRYFRTASDAEAAAIRANPATGEQDTGRPFKAWSGLAYPIGTQPVFRFYGSVTPGPNSHFFTANVDEARALQRTQLDTPAGVKRWNYEELSFAVRPPQGGGCPAEVPVRIYRVYNDGFAKGKDSNHRLLTDFDLYTQMIAQGWIGEGVAMCGPQ